jgi:predicted ATPase
MTEKQRLASSDNDSRIKGFMSTSAQILIDFAPDLIETFVPGVALIAKLGKSVAVIAGLTDRLEKVSKRKKIEGEAGTNNIQQSQIFEQYTQFLQAYSHRQPLIIVLDDLHWADSPSINLLFHLSRRISDKRILIIGTFRPVEITLQRAGQPHPLAGVITELKRYHGDFLIDLSAIGDTSERLLVDQLVDLEPNQLGETFRRTLHRQTNGNPLFVVELLEDMKESSAMVRDSQGLWVESANLAWDKLPARVEGVIERRINRLDTHLQTLLSVGSIEGEEFTAEVIARAQAADPRGVVQLLSADLDQHHRLVNAQGVQRLGYQRLSMYQFQHNLFQKYLYNRLDSIQRSYLHEDVGIILEELYADHAEKIAVKLARHFKEAGIYEKAVHYLYLAGTRALTLSSHHEAVTHFSEGLALLANLPPIPTRDHQELLLQTMLGQALIATEGYAASTVEGAFSRARLLCETLGDTPQLFPVLWGLWAFYEVRGQYNHARQLGDQMLQLAQSQPDQHLSILAHFAIGNTSFLLGDLDRSLHHFEQVASLYDPTVHNTLAILYGQDPAVTALSWKSVAHWLLGHPDTAVETIQAALDLAHQRKHPFTLAYALYCATWLYQMCRDIEPLQTYAQELIPLAQSHGFPFWLSVGLIQQAWAVAQSGKISEAIAQLEQGINLWRNIGAHIGEPYYLSILAEVYGAAGRIPDGLQVLVEAREIMAQNGESWEEALLDLAEGELHLLQAEPDHDQAQACFQHAMQVAQKKDMKALVLRAALRLNHLYRYQGKSSLAEKVLAPIYNDFTEGFETADLVTARLAFEPGG